MVVAPRARDGSRRCRWSVRAQRITFALPLPPPARMRLTLRLTAALLLAASAATPLAAQGPRALNAAAPRADLIVTNARIYTVDDSRPIVEAMAVRGGRVAFVGAARGALALRGPATRVRRPRRPHGHPRHGGRARAPARPRRRRCATWTSSGTRSYDEVIARVVERARHDAGGHVDRRAAAGTRTTGATRASRRTRRSRARVPDHPVYLDARRRPRGARERGARMRAANVTAATQGPDGGAHRARRPTGAPTGVFIDNAQGLVERAIPRADARRAARGAARRRRARCTAGASSACTTPARAAPTIDAVRGAWRSTGELDLRALRHDRRRQRGHRALLRARPAARRCTTAASGCAA